MIFGLEATALPDRWTPLEAVAVVKCLDEDGHEQVYCASTPALRVWDAVGLLTCALDTMRGRAQKAFCDEEDDE